MHRAPPLVIFGCGGHARSVADVALRIGIARIVFVDPAVDSRLSIFGQAVIAAAPPARPGQAAIVAIGDNRRRAMVYREAGHLGYSMRPIISPDAYIGHESIVGDGVFVGGGAHIGPCVQIGENSIINTHAVIEHEVEIGAHAHVAGNAIVAGRCCIGGLALIGVGAVVRDGVTVCAGAIVGAGAVVVTNVEEPAVYVGVPARPLDAERDAK